MAVFVIFGSHGFPGMKPPAVETVRLKESGGGGADMKKVRASLCILGVTAAAVTVMMVLPALSHGALRTENVARVRLCRVENGCVEQVLAAGGVVRYESEYAAIAPATGVVEKVYVRAGDRVRKGQALFRMNGEVQAAAVSAALISREGYTQAAVSAAGQAGLAVNLSSTGQPSAALTEAGAALECLTVRAAADGMVQQVSVCEHGGAMAGSAAVLLSGEKQAISVSMVLRDAEKVQRGMKARILRDGETAAWATVSDVSPAQTSETTGQTVCEVRLTPEENLPQPLGAAVEAEIILYGQENVPVLPVEAVTEADTVWWADEGRCWEIPVEVVMADEVSCWVNLPEGMTVVCGGEGTVQGQRIKEMRP